MPHVSLLYAELQAEEKERLVSELETYGLSGKLLLGRHSGAV